MIEILFFSHLQETVGAPKITWTEVPITVGQLKQKLAEKYSLRLNSVLTSVNEEYADDNLSLNLGDIIAFIPPVSGG